MKLYLDAGEIRRDTGKTSNKKGDRQGGTRRGWENEIKHKLNNGRKSGRVYVYLCTLVAECKRRKERIYVYERIRKKEREREAKKT